jgi:Transcription factor WhiB
MSAADLFAELGAHTPALPAAACRHHVALFDDETAEAVAEAVQICASCPELARCADWAAGQSPRHLLGVIAGKRYRENVPRKSRRKAQP